MDLFKLNTLKYIEKLFSNTKDRTWDYNILITECYFNPTFLNIDNNIGLVTTDFCTEHYGINAIYPPLPLNKDYEITDKDIEYVLDYLESVNGHQLCGIFCIPDSAFDKLDRNRYAVYEYYPEYIYDVDEQIKLEGAKFKTVRRAIHKFEKNSFEIEELNKKKHLTDCMVLSEQKPLFEHGLYNCILKYEDLKIIDPSLYGFVVKVHGKLVGFSISSMHGDTAYNLIRRVDHATDGITEFLNLHMLKYYREINPNLKYFNDGDDGGFEGLNLYKVKMKPVSMKYIFEIYKPEIPLETCIKV